VLSRSKSHMYLGVSKRWEIKSQKVNKSVQIYASKQLQTRQSLLYLSLSLYISLMPVQWVSTTSSIQEKGGRRVIKKKQETSTNQSPARNPVPQIPQNERKTNTSPSFPFPSLFLQSHMSDQLNATLQFSLHITHLRLERHILHPQPLHNRPRRPITPQPLDAIA
jgi:hypothetical protein